MRRQSGRSTYAHLDTTAARGSNVDTSTEVRPATSETRAVPSFIHDHSRAIYGSGPQRRLTGTVQLEGQTDNQEPTDDQPHDTRLHERDDALFIISHVLPRGQNSIFFKNRHGLL